ncbi:hypothetical protein [Nocardia inohanensis]|uniref:hypothetical protein n=1 Tax=Nocardia inohanensis TaxID=209246 RepID=UPI00082C45B1|nr:hypothetical protein [Nocardia inohanensis]
MRFAKTGAAAAILAAVLTAGAGVTHAGQTITLTADLMGCAARANLDVSGLAAVEPGSSVQVSDAMAAELRQSGCMP